MSKIAIFSTSGHQYRVKEGDVLKLQRHIVDGNEELKFQRVLSIQDGDDLTIGAPTVDGAEVIAEVLEQKRDKKIVVFKKKRRQNYRRKAGHKQHLTVVKIKEIKAA